MDLTRIVAEAESARSDDHVRRVVGRFLGDCGWALEIDDSIVAIPRDTELYFYSRAIVLSGHGFGNVLQAVVFLGTARSGPNVYPALAMLRVYLSVEVTLITEDRHSAANWARDSSPRRYC